MGGNMGGEGTGQLLDVRAVLERMAIAAGVRNISELSEITGLSAQALTQSKYRGSIALSLIMRVSEKTGCTTDFLIYGTGTPKGEDEYIQLRPINDADKGILSAVKFEKKWLKNVINIDEVDSYRLLAVGNDISIIDITDRAVGVNFRGTFALGSPGDAFVRHCQVQMNGYIVVENEIEAISKADLMKVGILGKVVWRGSKA